MNKRDNIDNNLDTIIEKKENDAKTFEEVGTEVDRKYDQYEPVPCLNCGYH